MSPRTIVTLLFALLTLTQSKESAFIEKYMKPDDKEVRVIGAEKPIVSADFDSELTTAKAGFVSTFTSKFFTDYNKFILEIFTEKMQNFVIEDHCNEQAVGNFFTGYLCAKNQKLLEFVVDQENSKLVIVPEQEALRLSVMGLELNFEFDFRVWSEPKWLDDHGLGYVKVGNCDIHLDLQLKNVDGALQVDFEDVKVDLHDYSVVLDGESDLSRAIEIMFTSFKSFFRQELTSMLAWRLAKSVEESLNQVLL